MKILILTQNYIPEPDPKMHILAKGLVKKGHTVKVITGFPNYPQGKIYPGYRQKLWMKEEIDGVKIVRLPLYPDRSRSQIKRAANYLSFPLIASILGPIFCGKADIMLVYHPPVTLGIPAWIISRLRRIPFVFEIQDMWPETLPAIEMVSNPAILNILGALGKFVYDKAAAITVISSGFKRNLISKGVPGNKIHVLYNWAYEGNYELGKPNLDLAEKLGLKGRFNVLYAGNMGPAQGLQNVVEAAEYLRDLRDFQFVLIGSGIDRDQLEELTKKKNLNNILFLPRQPMKMMPALYPLVEAVMVHLTDDPLFEITIPGKTQSCLASGRPVIVSVNGDAADMVLEAKAGIAAKAMNAPELARAVRKLYNMSSVERKIMGESGRNYYLNNLSPNVQIIRYEKLFQQIIDKK